ncbi:MAG TPA: hypothetical protein VJV39_03005 [Dongiaceae bacterium]|nr:hypothetical protein [Dongiaceae bacterium]
MAIVVPALHGCIDASEVVAFKFALNGSNIFDKAYVASCFGESNYFYGERRGARDGDIPLVAVSREHLFPLVGEGCGALANIVSLGGAGWGVPPHEQ